MATEYLCFRCGATLAELTPPIARQDECPACSAYLHVCHMCEFFDPHVATQCTEDDAEEVLEKQRPNFCEWYKPGISAFDPQRAAQETRVQDELASLFGEEEAAEPVGNAQTGEAENLFK